MKKITLIISLTLFAFGFSQTAINFNATAFSPDPIGVGLGFMNVFDNPKDGNVGGYQFGSGWGIQDLIAELDTGANTITLKPNRIGDTDPYWQSAGVLEGNKIMDANCFIQDDALVGTSFTFSGNVVSNTLDGSSLSIDFVKIAFIKVFNSDFSALLMDDTVSLDGAGEFTLSMNATMAPVDAHVQYGFQIIGPNINSDGDFDEAYDNLGSIVVEPAALSVEDFVVSDVNIFPNPSKDNWSIKLNNQIIKSITIYNVLGKEVSFLNPNSEEVLINGSDLNDGIYLAKISTDEGSKTIKLIKN